jgi:hypothetical protein
MQILNVPSKLDSLLIIMISLFFIQTVSATSPCPGELALAQKRVDMSSGLGTPCLLWMLAAVMYVMILLITMLSGYCSLKGPRLKTLDGTQQAVDSQELAYPEYLPFVSVMVPIMSLVLMNPLFGGSQWSIVVLSLASIIGCAKRKHGDPQDRFCWPIYLLFGSILIHGVICITLASMDSISLATAWIIFPWICAMFVVINVGVLGFTKPTSVTVNQQPLNERDDEGTIESEDTDNEGTPGVEPRDQRQRKRLSKTETAHRMWNDLKFMRWTARGRR